MECLLNNKNVRFQIDSSSHIITLSERDQSKSEHVVTAEIMWIWWMWSTITI